MNRLVLRHLTMFGEKVETVSVNLGRHMTLIRGPSDTGKSFIANAIDFMLGAKALQDVRERVGYSTVLLGLTMPNGEEVTLARSTKGGQFSLFTSDVRDGPLDVAERTLSQTHNAKNEDNLSNWLLKALGLEGREMQKNKDGNTHPLSFRDLVHLCIVDETQIQSKVPPAQKGNYPTRTKEISVLRSLLEDDDDSATAVEASVAKSKLAQNAKVEVYDKLLADLEADMQDAPTEKECHSQMAKLNQALSQYTGSMKSLRAERDDRARDRIVSQNELVGIEDNIGDASSLIARFELLRAQYMSDLARLEMLREAGNLLGFFDVGVCPFCGAEPGHQLANKACDGDVTSLNESVTSEGRRTHILLSDLVATIADLEEQRSALARRIPSLESTIKSSASRIAELERQMEPVSSGLDELFDARSKVDNVISNYRRRDMLEEARSELISESARDTSQVAAKMQLAVIAEFSTEISACLEAWGVPESGDARYDRGEQDIVQADQLRSDHGKGMRSILHAAFTIGLAQFCITRDLPHPGFVVLDSPILTYRPPDSEDAEGEGTVPPEFADAFYEDMQTRFLGQVIILENDRPPTPLSAQTVEISFSKNPDLGRYGYFPHGTDGDNGGLTLEN